MFHNGKSFFVDNYQTFFSVVAIVSCVLYAGFITTLFGKIIQISSIETPYDQSPNAASVNNPYFSLRFIGECSIYDQLEDHEKALVFNDGDKVEDSHLKCKQHETDDRSAVLYPADSALKAIAGAEYPYIEFNPVEFCRAGIGALYGFDLYRTEFEVNPDFTPVKAFLGQTPYLLQIDRLIQLFHPCQTNYGY